MIFYEKSLRHFIVKLFANMKLSCLESNLSSKSIWVLVMLYFLGMLNVNSQNSKENFYNLPMADSLCQLLSLTNKEELKLLLRNNFIKGNKDESTDILEYIKFGIKEADKQRDYSKLYYFKNQLISYKIGISNGEENQLLQENLILGKKELSTKHVFNSYVKINSHYQRLYQQKRERKYLIFAKKYIDSASFLIENLEDYKSRADYYFYLGSYFLKERNFEEALINFKKSLALTNNQSDPKKLARLYNNIGFVYGNTENDKGALEYYKKALELDKKMKDSTSIFMSLMNIGGIYLDAYEADISLLYSLDALRYQEKAGNERIKSTLR